MRRALAFVGKAAIVLAIPAAAAAGVAVLSNSDAGQKTQLVEGEIEAFDAPRGLQPIRVTVSLFDGTPRSLPDDVIPIDQAEHNLSIETGIDQAVTRRFQLYAADGDGNRFFVRARVELSDFSGLCGDAPLPPVCFDGGEWVVAGTGNPVPAITVRVDDRC